MLPRRSALKTLAAAVPAYLTLPFLDPAFAMSSKEGTRLRDDVVPRGGIATPIAFGDTIQTMIVGGVLDPDKYRALYKHAGGLPPWVEDLLARPSERTIVFSPATAPHLLNLLWPLGLATRASFNRESPLHTLRVPMFASTGGWSLGRDNRGFAYFDSHETLRFDPGQENLVLRIAVRSFRPCCDNSAFFQDCNHGSALLGLIELAASQGLPEEEIERAALVANSYWFADTYVGTALYFSSLQGRSWASISPKVLLSADFSSLSGWQRNVAGPLVKSNVMPPFGLANQLACGV